MRTSHAATGAGYMTWSILDNTVAVQVPWTDVIFDDTLNPAVVADVLRGLRQFETEAAKAAKLPESQRTWPPMPTPNARIVRVNPDAKAEFDAGLAEQLVAYKKMLRQKGDIDG